MGRNSCQRKPVWRVVIGELQNQALSIDSSRQKIRGARAHVDVFSYFIKLKDYHEHIFVCFLVYRPRRIPGRTPGMEDPVSGIEPGPTRRQNLVEKCVSARHFQCCPILFKSLFNVLETNEVNGFHDAKVVPMVVTMGVVVTNYPSLSPAWRL